MRGVHHFNAFERRAYNCLSDLRGNENFQSKLFQILTSFQARRVQTYVSNGHLVCIKLGRTDTWRDVQDMISYKKLAKVGKRLVFPFLRVFALEVIESIRASTPRASAKLGDVLCCWRDFPSPPVFFASSLLLPFLSYFCSSSD